MVSCWMCATDLLHPDVVWRKSSCKAPPLRSLFFSTAVGELDDLRAEPQGAWMQK